MQRTMLYFLKRCDKAYLSDVTSAAGDLILYKKWVTDKVVHAANVRTGMINTEQYALSFNSYP